MELDAIQLSMVSGFGNKLAKRNPNLRSPPRDQHPQQTVLTQIPSSVFISQKDSLDTEHKLLNQLNTSKQSPENEFRNAAHYLEPHIHSHASSVSQNHDETQTISEIFEEFPDLGLSHLQLTENKDHLQSTVTPYDFHQPVQVLRNPNDTNQFITVQIVHQSVKKSCQFKERQTKPTKILCEGHQEPLKFVKSDRIADTNCSQCSKPGNESGNYLCGAIPSCQTFICPDCYTQYFVRRQLEQKTAKHYYYTDFQIVKPARQRPKTTQDYSEPHKVGKVSNSHHSEGQEFAVVGFWRDNNCYAQFKVNDPVIYVRKNQKTFLHVNNQNEVHYLQRQGDSILEVCCVDMAKISGNQQNQIEVGPLPLKGQTHSIVNTGQGLIVFAQLFGGRTSRQESQIQQTTLQFEQNMLILQVHKKYRQKFSAVAEADSISFYNYITDQQFDIEGGVLFLKFIEDAQNIFYVDKNGQFLTKKRTTETQETKNLLKLPISKTSDIKLMAATAFLIDPKHKQKTFKRDVDNSVAFPIDGLKDMQRLMQSPILTAYIHNGDTKCTIVSDKKTITYDLRFEMKDGRSDLIETCITTQEWHDPIAAFIQDDKLILCVGLITSDEEIKTNMVPFDINVYCFEAVPSLKLTLQQLMNHTPQDPYKKLNRVTVMLPNNVLPTTDANLFTNIMSPLSYNVVGKDQLACCLFIQSTHKLSKPHLIYTNSFSSQQQGISFVMLRQKHNTTFPIQISSTYHPRSNKVLIANLSINKYRQMLDLGEYRFVSFINGPLQNTCKSTRTSVAMVRVYILVSHPQLGLRVMRYELPTMPGYYENKIQQNELHIDTGEICFNLNEIKLSERFPHEHNIMQAYLWRPIKKEMTDVYVVIQTLESVLLFNLDRGRTQEEHQFHDLSRDMIIAPVPFVYYKQYCYFIKKESNVSSQVIAIEIEPKGKPQQQVIHHQNSLIIAMKINDRDRNSQNHALDLIDSDKVMHKIALLAESNGVTVNLKKNYSVGIDQNMIHINRDMNWHNFCIGDRTFMFLEKGKLVMKVLDAMQKFSYKPIQFWKDLTQDQPVVAVREVVNCAHVHKEQVMVEEGTFCFIHTKHDVDSRFIDVYCDKIQSQVKQVYLWGSQIVVQMQNDVLVYFDERQMISHVDKFNFDRVIDRGCLIKGEDEYVVQEQRDIINIYRHSKHYDFTLILKDFKLLKKQIKEKFKSKYGTMKNFTKYPCLNNLGVPVLVWLCKPGEQQGKKKDHIIVRKEIIKKPKSFNDSSLDVLSTERKENVETEMKDEILCICFFVHDFPNMGSKDKRQDQKYKMEVICTRNYLVWTTPNKLNFVKFKAVDSAEEFRIKNVGGNFVNKSFHRDSTRCKKFLNQSCRQIGALCKHLTPGSETVDVLDTEEVQDDDRKPSDMVEVQKIDMERILVTEMLQEKVRIFSIKNENRKFVIRDNKPRVDSIQIKVGNQVSIIWDLNENEEVTFLMGWSHLNSPECIVRSGHRISTNTGYDIVSNKDCSIFVGQKWIVRLYAEVDLLEMKDIVQEQKLGRQIKQIDVKMLIANVRGQTFLTPPVPSYDQLQFIISQLKSKDLTPHVDQSNLLAPQQDHHFLRQLYQILLLPCKIIQPEDGGEKQLSPEHDKGQSILQYALHTNKLLFKQVLQLLLMSSEIRLSNIVSEFTDMDQLLASSNEFVYKFLERSMIQTKQTRAVASFNSTEKHKSFIFGENTPLILEQRLRKQFESEVKGDTNTTEVLPYLVTVLEVEWLDGQLPLILQRIMNAPDEIFDNLFVKILMAQLDFTRQIIISMFIPYCIYMSLLVYYFVGYIVYESDQGAGFFEGGEDAVTLRCLSLIMSIYLGLIEFIQAITVPIRTYVKSPQNLNNVIMLIINMMLLIQHAHNSWDSYTLAVIASLSCLHMWWNLFQWMRVLPSTSIYVMLITRTVQDVDWFMLMFVICLCAFSTALMVLNEYQKMSDELHEFEDTQPLYEDSFSLELADAMVNQYLLSLGEFSFDNFSSNKAVILVWIYFLLSTFLSQIVFFNMLIAIMSTTYENVMQFRDRNVLRMRTKLFTDYIRWLNLIGKKQKKLFEQRYIYSASLQVEELNVGNKMEETVEDIKNRLTDGFKVVHSDVKDVLDAIKQQQDDQLKFMKLLKEDQVNLVRMFQSETVKMREEMKNSYDSQISELSAKWQREAPLNE